MSNLQQPPQFSDKIPMEAQALVMQPEALNMLRQVNGWQLLSLFFFQMPFMLLQKDVQSLEKGGKKLLLATGGSAILGIAANISLKKISLNFLKWPFYFRFPIRLGVMALPLIGFYPTISTTSQQLQKMLEKINRKKNQLVRTRNLEDYFQIQKPAPKGKQPNKKK